MQDRLEPKMSMKIYSKLLAPDIGYLPWIIYELFNTSPRGGKFKLCSHLEWYKYIEWVQKNDTNPFIRNTNVDLYT